MKSRIPRSSSKLELEISFDGEENGCYNIILFPIFCFPIIILFLNLHKDTNCANMYIVVHFFLTFTSDFYNCY
jgi:hypothetical protein